ncbi:hypothetical protein WN51_03114 [Melipona quadrifasciata]|uniref:Spaetzle domain-containing protein n=1 Tax=Melipona quadrifasciata TaxID=166423 RepID=A0A0M8ZWG4_9HYME|nr:hypothetical protein WN51_03114 [Melipona quadrifasciata]
MSSGYGSPTREPGHRTRRKRKSREAKEHDIPDGGPSFRDKLHPEIKADDDSFFANVRSIRNPRQSPGKNRNDSGRVDACESKVEIVTPYWASNSAGKIRAIVNTQHFEQAIHQEVCSKTQTNRCTGDCGCEQKYKWHRLLAYDPDNDCKEIHKVFQRNGFWNPILFMVDIPAMWKTLKLYLCMIHLYCIHE